jgi:hypothetical protein
MITTADLARAELCAQGPKQLELVQELAAGTVTVAYERIGHRISIPLYGKARLGHQSYRSLRKRLQEAGFTVDQGEDLFRPRTVDLRL